MRPIGPLVWLLLGVVATGCPATAYRCDATHACNPGSVCAADGYCAAPVGAAVCASGLRFSATAAAPGACVARSDAGVDAPASPDVASMDVPADAPPVDALGDGPDELPAPPMDAPDAEAPPDAVPPPDVASDDVAPPDVSGDVPLELGRADVVTAPDAAGSCAVRPIAPLSATRLSRSSLLMRVRVTGAAVQVSAQVTPTRVGVASTVALVRRADGDYEGTFTGTYQRLSWQASARCADGSLATGPRWSSWHRARPGERPVPIGWVPDVSGDGAGDLVVAEPRVSAIGPRPSVFVYLGTTSVTMMPGEVQLLPPPAPDVGFGSRVAVVPDMNGDGAAEVAVGRCARDPALPCARSVVVYTRSRVTGAWSAYATVAMPTVTAATPGLRADARFGATLAGIGDFDADGYGDLLIGAPPARADESGAFYLLYGGPSPTLSGGYSLTAMPTGGAPRTYFAWDAAGVADLHGDGLVDFVVTSFQRAWVYRGAGRRALSTSEELSASVTAGSRYGFSVAAAGDLDADDRADFALGRAEMPDSGSVVVMAGRAGSFESARESFVVAGEGGSFGATLVGALDLNRDDRDDLVVGAPDGTSYLTAVWHNGGGLVSQRYNRGTLTPAGRLGRSLGATGDHNGDGFDDLAASALDVARDVGYVHAFRGAATMAPEPFVYTGVRAGVTSSFGLELGR